MAPSPTRVARRRALGLSVGLVAFQVPVKVWDRYAPKLFIVALILLVIVLVPFVGKGVNGARRWIPLGVMNFQPSELMKLAVVLYAANYTVRKQEWMQTLAKGFLPMGVAVVVVGMLLLLEPDMGAFLIKATQNSQNVDYVVTLRGKGDDMGLNTDVFRQDSKPKADILLVIDDSCSMADKQTALSQNFASFIRYANTAGVDYQIGVVTTYLNSATEGVLLGDAMNPKILRPSTPNVENLFRAKVI